MFVIENVRTRLKQGPPCACHGVVSHSMRRLKEGQWPKGPDAAIQQQLAQGLCARRMSHPVATCPTQKSMIAVENV